MAAARLVLLALIAGEPRRPEVAYVEVAYATHAGEGAQGVKRFFRDGCYTVKSSGGTGGGWARDSQGGCHLRRDVVEAFARLDALVANGGVVPERAAPSAGKGPVGQPVTEQPVLVGTDGSRWVAPANRLARIFLEAEVGQLPSGNLWFPLLPVWPGKGPVLVAIRWTHSGSRRLQASLIIDGRWSCARSAGRHGPEGAEASSPPRAPRAIAPAEARARLGRILRGARRPAEGDPDPKPVSSDGELSIEVAFADGVRDALHPRPLTRAVVGRFFAEMRRQSPACAAP